MSNQYEHFISKPCSDTNGLEAGWYNFAIRFYWDGRQWRDQINQVVTKMPNKNQTYLVPSPAVYTREEVDMRAIAFHEWVKNNEWRVDNQARRSHTTTQLYNIYLSELPSSPKVEARLEEVCPNCAGSGTVMSDSEQGMTEIERKISEAVEKIEILTKNKFGKTELRDDAGKLKSSQG